MKLGMVSKVLAKTYKDLMSISRYEAVVGEDGTTQTTLKLIPTYTDIPCRVSFSDSDNSETTKDDSNPIYMEIKVFCGPQVDIKKGDKLVVTCKDDDGTTLKTYNGNANLPFTYVSHKEIRITEVGEA
jgi:hypothetical protein